MKRFNIILTFCVMYMVYFLYFCRDFWNEILPIEAFCVGWNQYNSILHDKSSSIFFPPRVHMQIFFNKPTQKILHYFQDNSHIRGCMCGVWGWDIYFQVFADVTKGRYHQTLLLPRTPHDLWLAEMHHKNYLFYHSNYFWFKHGKTLA